MRFHVLWAMFFLLMLGCAEQRSAAPTEPAGEPTAIEQHLYPAALVLDHQAALELDDAQLEAIRSELSRSQAELVDAEVALRREREALATALATEHVDEATALEAAERVVDRERDIKLLNLRTMIRIKNVLTPAQQRELDALRR